MKDLTLLLLFLLSFGVQACAARDVGEYPKAKDPETKVQPDYVPDELLVLFRKGTTESRINAINESLNVVVVRTMLSGRITLIKIPKDKSLEELRMAYSSFPEVESVDLNYKIHGLKGRP